MDRTWVIIGAVALVLYVAFGDDYQPRHSWRQTAPAPAQYTPPVSAPTWQTDPAAVTPAGLTAMPSTRLYFKGDPCTIDCSGHEAGYEWAEENGIEDPDDCDGKSDSFIDGCRSYAEEQQTGSSRDEEEEE